jgi:uncharacterized membrane protein YqaE (UPF0057 family)
VLLPVPGAPVLRPPPAARRLPPPRLLLRQSRPPGPLLPIPLASSVLTVTPGFFLSVWEQMEFWISVVLTILGYVPGVLYAIYVILTVDPHRRYRDPDEDYVYVA